MIKYFQKLKAKKGFTLVELIVVIAIIGVLAAILIPTMLGYVTQSKVTSANSTAASIKNEVDAVLTNLDTVDKGMKKGEKYAVIAIENNGGTWKAQLSLPQGGTITDIFNDSTGTNAGWNTTLVTLTATDTKGSSNHVTALAADIKELFPEIKTGAVQVYLKGGKCMGVQYVNGGIKMLSDGALGKATWGTTGNTEWPSGCAWANQTAGIAASGDIIGTAPVIPLAEYTANNTNGIIQNTSDSSLTTGGSQGQGT